MFRLVVIANLTLALGGAFAAYALVNGWSRRCPDHSIHVYPSMPRPEQYQARIIRSYLNTLDDKPGSESGKRKTLQRVAADHNVSVTKLRQFRDGTDAALNKSLITTWAKLLGGDADLDLAEDPLDREWLQCDLVQKSSLANLVAGVVRLEATGVAVFAERSGDHDVGPAVQGPRRLGTGFVDDLVGSVASFAGALLLEEAADINTHLLPPSELHMLDQQLSEVQIEDLLGAALNIKIEASYLDVHYHLRKADLNEFSNGHFYNSRLQSIPGHPSNRARFAPLTLYKCKGVYEKRSNAMEADQVCKIVQDLLRRAQPPSIGIACFNPQQRDLIIERLDELAAEDPEFGRKLAQAKNRREGGCFAGLFVKNLESVPGGRAGSHHQYDVRSRHEGKILPPVRASGRRWRRLAAQRADDAGPGGSALAHVDPRERPPRPAAGAAGGHAGRRMVAVQLSVLRGDAGRAVRRIIDCSSRWRRSTRAW
jgi:hypothetical protein